MRRFGKRIWPYRRALVRDIPDSFGVSALKRHEPAYPIDLDKARQQHENYVHVLRRLVDKVIKLPEAPDCPDSCFVEDTSVVVGGRALICHMGAPSRRREVIGLESVFRECGLEVWAMEGAAELVGGSARVASSHADLPVDDDREAIMDGGDVLFTGSEIFVGLSERTSAAGAAALAAAFPGLPVWGIPLFDMGEGPGTPALHLQSFVTFAGPGRVVVSSETDGAMAVGRALMATAAGEPDPMVIPFHASGTHATPHSLSVTAVPDEGAANVVWVNGVLVHRSEEEFPTSAPILRSLQESIAEDPRTPRADSEDAELERGSEAVPPPLSLAEPWELDMSELAKADGALTCCSKLLPG